jgi:hypothetical protein
MKLNSIERAFVNNPVRAAHQHHREAAWFKRLAVGDFLGSTWRSVAGRASAPK